MKGKSLKTASGRTFLAAYATAFLLMVSTALFELQMPTNNEHVLMQASYGPSGTGRYQRFVAGFAWAAPRFSSFPALPRRVFTDREFSGIAVIQTGILLSVFDGNAGSVYGLCSARGTR
jgi:hypothetical protein